MTSQSLCSNWKPQNREQEKEVGSESSQTTCCWLKIQHQNHYKPTDKSSRRTKNSQQNYISHTISSKREQQADKKMKLSRLSLAVFAIQILIAIFSTKVARANDQQLDEHFATISLKHQQNLANSLMKRHDLSSIQQARRVSQLQDSATNQQLESGECGAHRSCENGGTCVESTNNFTCVCPEGFTGAYCQQDVNECLRQPPVCRNGATCLNKPGGFQCVCVNGWTGADCSENVDDCLLNACMHGAICHDRVGGFLCQCPPGKAGLLCQLDDGCYNKPCHPNATCDTSPVDGQYVCTCPQGFTGADCSIDTDECEAGSPCEHGGTCVNIPGSFRCECPRGFTGSRCEININECENNPCMNEGTCLDEKGGYKCICTQGFTGSRCQIDIDDCAKNPCHNGALCKDLVNSFRCICQPDFWGERCEFPLNRSDDINIHPPSDLTPCPVGWEGFKCSEDIDECAARNRCKNGGICLNYPGSYRCDCPEGFTGPNCERRSSATLGAGNPWAKCSNALSCWSAFKDGKCDQECNTAECLYDGNECATTISHGDNRELPSSNVPPKTCDEKSDQYCLKNYANNQCDLECNNAECGWDGADCESRTDSMRGSTEAQGLLVIRVEPAIVMGDSKSHVLDMELAKLLRKVSVMTKTILKIQNFRQVEEGNGTEIELIADNRKCQASCYNSTELIAKFLRAIKNRTKELEIEGNRVPGALKFTEFGSRNPDTIYPNQRSLVSLYIFIVCSLGAVFAVIMVISNSKQKVKEKAIVWFPEGFKPVLSSRNRDPTDKKGNRGVSTLQALGGNFFRGFKRNERNISTEPNGLHSTDVDRCTPNDGGIYHEPYDQYDQYGTYNGTDSSVINSNINEPMTPTPMPLNPVNIEGPHGLTPLMVASMGPPFSKEPLGLVAYGTTGEMNSSAENTVTELLQRGAQLNLAHKLTGETCLHIVARNGRVDVARGLLERCDSQDVNAQDATGRTPLHAAIAADSLGVFELLIRCRGTDLNAQTNDGTTPLILAVKTGTYSMLEELILNECEVTKSDSSGKTALHWAAATNNVDAIKRLLAVRETNKDAQDLAEETPLFLAAREGARGAVEILLSHNANKDISDQMDRSPIEIARSRNHYDIVRLLEDHEPPTPRSINSLHHSSRQMSPFSPLADGNSNSNSSSGPPPPPPSYHSHTQSGGGRNGGRQAQKAALARSSSTKPLIAEANIIRNNLQSHCKSVMVIKSEDKDSHENSNHSGESKTLGRRATQSISSSHQAIQPNMLMNQFGALSANNVVVMPATPNSLTNSLSPVSCSMMSPPTNSHHYLNSPTKSTPPININQMHRQQNGHPNQVPPPAYEECQTFWSNNNNNNNPNSVTVNNNNIVTNNSHSIPEVYNVPCLKNYMTPSPDSPFSLESSMASPPNAYTDQQCQNSNHPTLASQKQSGVFI